MSDRFKLKDTMAEPPGGWRIVNPEDHHLLRENTYMHLIRALRDYRISKNYPIGSNFEADAQNWMCLDIAEECCQPVEKYNPEMATLAQKASRFTRAMAEWARNGFPVVSDEVRAERMSACDRCSYFRPKGNAGLGQCTAPGCGCTKIKLWLKTSKCHYPGGSKWQR